MDTTVASPEEVKKCEEAFEILQKSDSKSLLKKYLTKEVLDKLKIRVTSFGSTLYEVIRSGIINLDSGVGIYAPDIEAYKTFAELFNPVIEEYHHGFKSIDNHPAPYWGNPKEFGILDPEGQFVISTRIRIGRSIENFPLNPKLTEEQYLEIEEKVKNALAELSGDFKGEFYSLSNMSADAKKQLTQDHFLFKEGDRFLEAANANRFWPTGRGIFHNTTKTFLVWCNEEDQLRIISMEKGSNVETIYGRLVNALKQIEEKICFSHDNHLGYLTFCPTNLGTTLRASVLIKIPHLIKHKEILNELVTRYKLQVRGTSGEHSDSEGGIVDVSNKRRMGLTEFQAVKEMYDGVVEIINMERCLGS